MVRMFSSFLNQLKMFQSSRSIFTSVCNQRAREGTRARKRAKLLKNRKPITKKEAHRIEMEKRRALQNRPKSEFENTDEPPSDNVYFHKWFKPPVYKLEEAVEMHREIFHPTVYNDPKCLLNATFELDMKLEKKNKFMRKIVGIVPISHKFLDVPDKKVLVLAKNEDVKLAAIKCGADNVGGAEIIKKYQSGALDFTSFSYVLAHPDILDEISPLRGILKTRFPSTANGSIALDIPFAIKQFKSGLEFESEQRPFQEHLGHIVLPFSRLDMHLTDIRDNFASIANYIESKRSSTMKRPLITKVRVWCKPHGETFSVDFSDVLEKKQEQSKPDRAAVSV